ncbi:MAG: phosphotransferase family protein [Burkholderiaceae bacterium]
MSTTTDLDPQVLARWLAERLPNAAGLSVRNAQTGAHGASAESVFFDLVSGGGEVRPMVLKRSPAGPKLFPVDDLAMQHGLMNALHGRGLPVPASLGVETDPSVLGGQFLVMPRMPGQAISDRPPGVHAKGLLFDATPAQRGAMWHSCVDTLARLHAVDCRHPDFVPLGDVARSTVQALRAQLDALDRLLTWCETEQPAVPDLRHALEWLRRNCPDTTSRLVVCWGDAKVGNILFDHGKLSAALDWELAYLGTPEDDLAYWMLVDETNRAVNKAPRLEGIPDSAGTIALYEQLSGRRVHDMDYHLTFQSLRLSVFLALVARLDAHTGAFGGRVKADDNPMIHLLRSRLD